MVKKRRNPLSNVANLHIFEGSVFSQLSWQEREDVSV